MLPMFAMTLPSFVAELGAKSGSVEPCTSMWLRSAAWLKVPPLAEPQSQVICTDARPAATDGASGVGGGIVSTEAMNVVVADHAPRLGGCAVSAARIWKS